MFSPNEIYQRSEDPATAQARAQAAGEHAHRVFISASEACLRLIEHYGSETPALYEAYMRSLASETIPTNNLGADGFENPAP